MNKDEGNAEAAHGEAKRRGKAGDEAAGEALRGAWRQEMRYFAEVDGHE